MREGWRGGRARKRGKERARLLKTSGCIKCAYRLRRREKWRRIALKRLREKNYCIDHRMSSSRPRLFLSLSLLLFPLACIECVTSGRVRVFHSEERFVGASFFDPTTAVASLFPLSPRSSWRTRQEMERFAIYIHHVLFCRLP